MMIVPSLSLNEQSLFVSIVDRDFSFTQLLADFYVGANGYFFVALIIQQACVSFAVDLLRVPELIKSYLSPWLAHHKRQVIQDQEPHMRKMTFQFGYFYAQMLTVFVICIFLSSMIPMLTIATAFYMASRHLVDLLNLLTVHRKEVDSQGSLINSATNTILFYIVAYQICMLFYFWVKSCQEQAVFSVFILIVTAFFIAVLYKPFSEVRVGLSSGEMDI